MVVAILHHGVVFREEDKFSKVLRLSLVAGERRKGWKSRKGANVEVVAEDKSDWQRLYRYGDIASRAKNPR